jgi:hypothetical protein
VDVHKQQGSWRRISPVSVTTQQLGSVHPILPAAAIALYLRVLAVEAGILGQTVLSCHQLGPLVLFIGARSVHFGGYEA